MKLRTFVSVLFGSALLVGTAVGQYTVTILPANTMAIRGLSAAHILSGNKLIHRDGSGETTLPTSFWSMSGNDLAGSHNGLPAIYNWSTSQFSYYQIGGGSDNRAGVYGTDAGQSVGQRAVGVVDPEYGDINYTYEAVLWRGAGLAPVVLGAASQFSDTIAGAIQGNSVVGRNNGRAYLWDATTLAGVDLTPSWASSSDALSVDGNIQGGRSLIGGIGWRPTIWRGSAASAVDLTPAGFSTGLVTGVRGSQQVGRVESSGGSRAILWNSSSTDYVDLQAILNTNSEGFVYTISGANGIGSDGSIYGSGRNAAGEGRMFILNVGAPVPEPASMAALGLGLLGLARRRRTAAK